MGTIRCQVRDLSESGSSDQVTEHPFDHQRGSDRTNLIPGTEFVARRSRS